MGGYHGPATVPLITACETAIFPPPFACAPITGVPGCASPLLMLPLNSPSTRKPPLTSQVALATDPGTTQDVDATLQRLARAATQPCSPLLQPLQQAVPSDASFDALQDAPVSIGRSPST